MELIGTPKLDLNEDAKRFINLYSSLGERAENFLPDHVFESLKNGVEEQIITDNQKYRIYMRAVRNKEGNLIGYYERYEPTGK